MLFSMWWWGRRVHSGLEANLPGKRNWPDLPLPRRRMRADNSCSHVEYGKRVDHFPRLSNARHLCDNPNPVSIRASLYSPCKDLNQAQWELKRACSFAFRSDFCALCLCRCNSSSSCPPSWDSILWLTRDDLALFLLFTDHFTDQISAFLNPSLACSC